MTSTATPAPSTSSTSTSSSPTTTSTAAGAPGVPEAARQHTEAGAIAFARHYVDEINRLGVHPVKGVLSQLATPDCTLCKKYAAHIDDLMANGRHNSGADTKIDSSKRIIGESGMVIEVIVHSLKLDIVDSNGEVVKAYPADATASGLVFDLTWNDGWRVSRIRHDENPHVS